jgi:hypothetical protein
MYFPKKESISIKIQPFISKKKFIALFLFLVFWGTSNVSFAQIESFLIADDGADGDQFGHAVAISGDYLISGAPYDDNVNGTDAGAVYVFKYEDNQWIFETKLLASDGSENELFGYNVDMEGEYIVVGCPWDDDAGEKSGAAFVYKREGGAWIEQAKLRADDASEDDRFGIDLKISAETVVVGAFFDDVVGDRSGSAYVFVREGTTWYQQAKLLPSDGATDDWFGVTLSLSDNDVAITARRHDELGGNSGAVYVFNRDGNTWTEQAKITAIDGGPGEEFGTPCISGNILIIGKHQDDETARNAGAFYFYYRDNDVWNLQAKYTASDGNGDDFFGSTIDMTTSYLVVGAYLDDMAGENAGSVYVFKREGLSCYQIAKLTSSNIAIGDYFGMKISLDGTKIVIGSRNQDTNGANAGAAYVFNMQETPKIVSVNDVPHDQGGYVEIKWNASFYDTGRNLSHYSIWRAIENPVSVFKKLKATKIRTTELNGITQTWGWVANVPGHRFEEYIYSAPTSCDSMATTDGVHYFMVSAHQDNDDIFFDSNVVSGYSVDNLAPPSPTGLAASLQGNQIELHWDVLPVPDFSHFLLYRNHEVLTSILENSFVDSNLENNQTYVYHLQAIDVHGNSSELSSEVSVMITSVAKIKVNKPETYRLFNNHPNPFNPETEIQFALPKTSEVVLKIYNTLGQEIKTLINAEYASGIYSTHWNGTDNWGNSVSSGIYIYVLQAGDFLAKMKMSLMK